jgi:hypothetical protein
VNNANSPRRKDNSPGFKKSGAGSPNKYGERSNSPNKKGLNSPFKNKEAINIDLGSSLLNS